MNIYEIYKDCFLDFAKHFRISDEAAEIFGESPSVIKNLYILKTYLSVGGRIQEPDFKNRDFVIEKRNLRITASSAINNYFISKEISFAESFLDNENYKDLAETAITDLKSFCEKGFELESFKEAYQRNILKFKKV